MSKIFENFRFLRSVDRERCLLEVGRIYGQCVGILTTVHWPQVAQNLPRATLDIMAFQVVEFSRQGFKIRKVFG